MKIPIVYYCSIKACDIAISNRALLTNQRSRNEFFFLIPLDKGINVIVSVCYEYFAKTIPNSAIKMVPTIYCESFFFF